MSWLVMHVSKVSTFKEHHTVQVAAHTALLPYVMASEIYMHRCACTVDA